MLSIVAAASIFFKQPIVDRSPSQMCREVEHELTIQVEEGMISRMRADQIVERCYRIFVHAK